MNKVLASSIALVGVLALAGCASSAYEDETGEVTPPNVVENTMEVGDFTLVQSIPVTRSPTMDTGIYKVCDGTTLVYFTYGGVGGTSRFLYYSASAPAAVPNAPECTTAAQ